MKNPNSIINRIKSHLTSRWSGEDYPGGTPRFQALKLSKDIGIFFLLPISTVIVFKAFESGASVKKNSNPTQQRLNDMARGNASASQIIEFRNTTGSFANGFTKISPGTLVRVKLLNLVETYSSAPVHAQIIDQSLGNKLIGGTLVGDAVPDPNFARINITFRIARDPYRRGVSASLSARALSLDGTLGIVAHKKESFTTRSVISSSTVTTQEQQSGGGDRNLRDILIKALTAGLIQEFGSEAQVEKNRAQVLSLPPRTEFFAELTDYFPGNSK